MATIGLKGIWGLEHLDRTGIATWKLGFCVLGASLLVGLLLKTILGTVNPDAVLASLYTPKVVSLILMYASFIFGLSIVLILFFARSTEADLRSLAEVDDAVSESINRLQPRLRLFLPITVLFMALTVLSIPSIGALRLDISLAESFSNYLGAGVVLSVLLLVLLPVLGVAVGVLFSTCATQILALNEAARRVSIKLPQLDQYSAIANPATKMIIVTLATSSLWPLMILFVDRPEFHDAMVRVAVLSLATILPLSLSFFVPVINLRNRIRTKKKQELEAIFRSLEGDEEAIKTFSISARGAPSTTSDLLTHQLFVESRWEWPIAAHVQKLILFGLLPPFTWVLAAAIENVMF